MKAKTIFIRALAMTSVVALTACAGNRWFDFGSNNQNAQMVATPTVDYVEQLDVYSAPHKDSFLNQLAMNYRSYAIYNARTSGYSDIGELFAQKAVVAFSGELPFPESLDNWNIADDQTAFELANAYNDLIEQLKNDASDVKPELAAEAQAKFDCWVSAAASGQTATANECRDRFNKTLTALRDCSNGKVVSNVTKITETETATIKTHARNASNRPTDFYPDTRTFTTMKGAGQARDGVIIVNNVNVPENLIQPVPVQPTQPMIFNQNIYSSDRSVSLVGAGAVCADGETECQIDKPSEPVTETEYSEPPMISEELVTREEFINMMMAMRAELAAINERLDKIQVASSGEKTMIKVQQIPLEPTQHVMEEILEIRFDFNKATIKPEYRELIEKLATATQNNKNIKVSVIGHTDTMGSKNYNYALGGRRAEAVQKMLIQYGIPASQIVAVSAGEEDLAVPTPDGVANADNRRVRVVKEVHYDAPSAGVPVAIEVEELSTAGDCGEYGCQD